MASWADLRLTSLFFTTLFPAVLRATALCATALCVTAICLGGWILSGCERCGTKSGERIRVESHPEPSTGRAYRVFDRLVPAPEAPHRPLLLVLHPYGVGSDLLLEAYDLVEHAVIDRGWLLVVPEGTIDSKNRPRWNATAACCGAELEGPDDVDFLVRVLDDVRRHSPFDARRVFVLGVSNGAFMAHRLACERSTRVRAIASIAGAGMGPSDPPCQPREMVSVLTVHGDRDATIHHEGGRRRGAIYPSVEDTLAPWITSDCQSDADSSRRLSWRGPHVTVTSRNCANHRVELWMIPGGDHLLRPLRHGIPRLLEFLSAAPGDRRVDEAAPTAVSPPSGENPHR